MSNKKRLIETTDTILVENNKGEEVELTGTFRDGYAILTDEEGKTAIMTYPKYDDLSASKIRSIEEYTSRELEEYFEIALKYGKIDDKESIKEEAKNVIRKKIDYINVQISDKEKVVITDNIDFSTSINGTAQTFAPLELMWQDSDSFVVYGLFNDEEATTVINVKYDFLSFETVLINWLFNNIEKYI